KGWTGHFERETHNAFGLEIEFRIAQKLRGGHGNLLRYTWHWRLARGGARRPVGGHCTAGDPESFGCEAVSRPTGMSSGVRMRFSYVQAHKWPEAPDVAQYRALLGCPTPTLWGPPV